MDNMRLYGEEFSYAGYEVRQDCYGGLRSIGLDDSDIRLLRSGVLEWFEIVDMVILYCECSREEAEDLIEEMGVEY